MCPAGKWKPSLECGITLKNLREYFEKRPDSAVTCRELHIRAGIIKKGLLNSGMEHMAGLEIILDRMVQAGWLQT